MGTEKGTVPSTINNLIVVIAVAYDGINISPDFMKGRAVRFQKYKINSDSCPNITPYSFNSR
jgi:hypothetical protein